MKRSTDRILTTHIGSLPRPNDIIEMVMAQGKGRDAAADAKRLKESIAQVVRKQANIGLDIINDGEYSKLSFVTYVRDRIGGLSEIGGERGNPWGQSRDARAFPDYYARMQQGAALRNAPRIGCTEPISYIGQPQLDRDIDNFRAALKGVKVVEAFVPSISIANVENWNINEYYKSEDDYLAALGDVMHTEYKAIVDAGFLLQIDDPRLITYFMIETKATVAQTRRWAQKRVEVLNHALRDIPRDKVRYHTCYSINMGPRVFDMEAKDLFDIIYKIKAGAFSFEGANPRHEHEWMVWCSDKRPKDAILIPGVVTHCSVLVEHPELVAQRIVRYADLVGRENVIAGADCGFASFAGNDEIDPAIAWAKLEALVKGAEIASKQLWSRGRKPAVTKPTPAKSGGAKPRRAAKKARSAPRRPVKAAKRSGGARKAARR